MAKKSMIEREKKRYILIKKFAEKRTSLKNAINKAVSMEEKLVLHRQLQNLPKNSSPVRFHNRCSVTGRPRGYYKDLGLSRNILREYALQGLLPGITKSSW
jgi:small subunit ribosomal protein S14